MDTDFQPIPKRFMVWDTKSREWLHGDVLREFIECNMQHPEDNAEEDIYEMYVGGACKIVQSTNLFDKDGKEIFEGHIVRVGGETGTVQMVHGEWHAVGDDDIPLSVWKSSGIEILGHILSNPELMKEKAC